MTQKENTIYKNKIVGLIKSDYDIKDILFFMSGYAPNLTVAELTGIIFDLREEGYGI